MDKTLYSIGRKCVDDQNATNENLENGFKNENMEWKEIAGMNENDG